MKRKQTKRKMPRDKAAQVAHFRNSSGPIKDAKKEDNKNRCRKSKRKRKEESYRV